MSQVYILRKSPRKDKKFLVVTPENKNIYFGASGYQDYTMHHDPQRKERYIKRHQKRENWNKNGINTAGWWSRWLLWNLPDFNESLDDIEARFSITIDEDL